MKVPAHFYQWICDIYIRIRKHIEVHLSMKYCQSDHERAEKADQDGDDLSEDRGSRARLSSGENQ